MAKDFVGVKVVGLSALQKDIKRFDPELQKELKKEAKEALSGIVKPVAERLAPKVSGTLAGNIRVLSAATRASLAVGSKARVPYAGPIHWGWKRRGIAPNPFLQTAAYDSTEKIERAYFKTVDTLLNRVFDGRKPVA